MEREEMRKLVVMRNQKREETKAQGGSEELAIRRNRVVNIARTERRDKQEGDI